MGSPHEVLSSAFQSLRLSDGTPDRARRKAELSAFLDTLEHWELWHIRALSKEKLKFADLPDLPDEIIGLIAQHLDHYDIAVCARVCKSWSSAFKRAGIVRYLISQHFPGLLQAATDGNDSVDIESPESYQRKIRQRALRHRGKFFTTLTVDLSQDDMGGTCFTMDQSGDEYTARDVNPNPIVGKDRPPKILYDHGRVAWELADNCTIIDSLDTLQRRMIKWPKATRLILQALSEDLVVLSDGDDQKTLRVYLSVHPETRR